MALCFLACSIWLLPQTSELGEISYEKEPTENVTTWVYEDGSYPPIAKLINGQRYSIVSDYIGRPVQCFDDTGEVVWETDYDIYGRLKNLKGRDKGIDDWGRPIWEEIDRCFIPFRQMGQYEDVELGGLYYNRFRYYDSGSGIYISQDPIGLLSGELNFYSYVKDSNSWVDIFGLDFYYQLFKEGKVVYHGITKNPIAQRLMDHVRSVGKDFDSFRYLEVDGRIPSRDLEGSALHHAKGQGLQNNLRKDNLYYHSYDPGNLKPGRAFYSPEEIEAKMQKALTGKVKNAKLKCG